jgi:multiple sugar transport system substrate-binding protein
MKILKHFAPVLLLAAGAVAGTGAAQAADVTFMGYSYAEESAKPSVETIIKGFEKQAGLTVEPIGSAWGDMQKNLFLRIRSRTAPDVAQISER